MQQTFGFLVFWSSVDQEVGIAVPVIDATDGGINQQSQVEHIGRTDTMNTQLINASDQH